MTFLVWDNLADAEVSLSGINELYGLPFKAANGYKMNQWDFVYIGIGNDFGFFKPEDRLGILVDFLMASLVGVFVEHETPPPEFIHLSRATVDYEDDDSGED